MGRFSAGYSSPLRRWWENTQALLSLSGALTTREVATLSRLTTSLRARQVVKASCAEITVRWDRMEALLPGGFVLAPPTEQERQFWDFIKELSSLRRGAPKPIAKRGRPSRQTPTARQNLFATWESLARWRNRTFPTRRRLIAEIVGTADFEAIYKKFCGWLAGDPSGRIDEPWLKKIAARFVDLVPDATYEALRDAGKTTPEQDAENERMVSRMCAMDRIYARDAIYNIGALAHCAISIFGTSDKVPNCDLISSGFPHPGVSGSQWIAAADALEVPIERKPRFLAGLENIERVLVERVRENVPVSFWEVCLNARSVDFTARQQFYSANPLP